MGGLVSPPRPTERFLDDSPTGSLLSRRGPPEPRLSAARRERMEGGGAENQGGPDQLPMGSWATRATKKHCKGYTIWLCVPAYLRRGSPTHHRWEQEVLFCWGGRTASRKQPLNEAPARAHARSTLGEREAENMSHGRGRQTSRRGTNHRDSEVNLWCHNMRPMSLANTYD